MGCVKVILYVYRHSPKQITYNSKFHLLSPQFNSHLSFPSCHILFDHDAGTSIVNTIDNNHIGLADNSPLLPRLSLNLTDKRTTITLSCIEIFPPFITL